MHEIENPLKRLKEESSDSSFSLPDRWKSMYSSVEHLLRIAATPLMAFSIGSGVSKGLAKALRLMRTPTFSSWESLCSKLVKEEYAVGEWPAEYASELKEALKCARSNKIKCCPDQYAIGAGTNTEPNCLSLFRGIRNFGAHSSVIFDDEYYRRDLENYLPVFHLSLIHI